MGLLPTDLYKTDEPEDAMKNAARFERLWNCEIDKCKEENEKRNSKSDEKKPSLSRVAWQFGRTRFIVCLFLIVLSMLFQFAGPVGFCRMNFYNYLLIVSLYY